MKLANVIKDSLDKTSPCLNAIKSASVFMFEHPLNHSKRLGVIRLNNKSLETREIIEQVQQQLIAWQNDERVIGVWFENDKLHLNLATASWANVSLDDLNKIGLNELMRQIKGYPKVSMVWCDQAYSPAMSLLFDAVNFSLVHEESGYQLFDNQAFGDASRAQLKLCPISHDKEHRARPTFIHVYPMVCHRHRLLELLSSHPWHRNACRVLELRFSRLFEEGLTFGRLIR